MSETMELTVVNAQNAVQIFTGGGLDAILAGIEGQVRAWRLAPAVGWGLFAMVILCGWGR
jgi:hypothetical protein